MAAVGEQDAVFVVDAVLFQILKLFEEARDVDDASSADEVDAAFGEDSGCCRKFTLASDQHR